MECNDNVYLLDALAVLDAGAPSVVEKIAGEGGEARRGDERKEGDGSESIEM